LALRWPLVVLLAAAIPGAALLGLERGLAYGQQRHRTLATSLLAEPAARLGAGLALAAVLGPTGAAIGAVLGGYTALGACLRDPLRQAENPPAAATRSPDAVATGVVFVLLAVLQSIDLLVANHRLDTLDASYFGALS